MEILASIPANVALGLETALLPMNLLLCLSGVMMGMLVGVIPGVGVLTALALLLPVTYSLNATSALIMLSGVYYGTAYGGSIASILLNLPGETASAVNCLDGFPMAQQGRAGVALMLNAMSAFFGASMGILLLMLFSPLIVNVALQFGPVEYFSIIVLGLMAASAVSQGSVVKAIAMAVLGMAVGAVGTDVYTGTPRLMFGEFSLSDGISLVALAVGLFGIPEVITSINHIEQADISSKKITLQSMKPTRAEIRGFWAPALRGSAIGSFFGIMPGTGATISGFMAYLAERKISRDPSRFGKGAIEGVIAPEASHNACDQTAFIPTLSLGIPAKPTMAIMLGALMIHGITPGPNLMADKPDVFWGLIMSFWIGNLMLLVVNIPLIGLWVRLLAVPYHLMYPAVLVFVCVGIFSENISQFEVFEVIVFGVLGYTLRLLDFPPAPLLLGFILGPMAEEQFRRSMLLSGGDFMTFLESSISAGFLAITAAILIWALVAKVRSFRVRAPQIGENTP